MGADSRRGNLHLGARWSPLGWSDGSSVAVAIALLDTLGRKLVPDLNVLSKRLADPDHEGLNAQPPQLMAEIWWKKLSEKDFASQANIPRSVASPIFIYQRDFVFGAH